MKMAILEIYPNKKFDASKGIDAHLRNSIIIGKYMNADVLITENDYLVALKKKYDVLMLSYTAFYAPFQLIKKMVENNPNAPRILIQNDYEQISFVSTFPPPFIYITGFEGYAIHEKHVAEHYVFNINLLFAKEPNQMSVKKYDCIYYGTFRKDRQNDFKKYLQNEIYLSTSDKNFKKYKHIGCDPIWIRKLSWMEKRETLNHFRFSLYIEDESTHSRFCNLANRWYESGFCNVIQLFDRNCMNTIKHSELGEFIDEIEPFIVDDHESLLNTIEMMKPEWNKWMDIQKRWRKNELNLRFEMLDGMKKMIEQKIEQNENR